MSAPHDEPTGVYHEDDYDAPVYDGEIEDGYDSIDAIEDIDDEPEPRRRERAPRNRARQAPRNMSRLPRPQDHRKPKRRPQAQREAEGDDEVAIEYRGRTYYVPADQDEWSIDAMEAFERNLMFAGVGALLGPRQWAEFKARHNNRKAFREFLDEVADVFGFETAGN